MNSISFSETLSNTLDMVSEWPKKRSHEPSILANLRFFTIDTSILPHFFYVRITFYLQTGHFYPPRARILYREAECGQMGSRLPEIRRYIRKGKASTLRRPMQRTAITRQQLCPQKSMGLHFRREKFGGQKGESRTFPGKRLHHNKESNGFSLTRG